jgi:hypothetical protein
MPTRKNIFVIGRKGHEGDENQLTEMLAYLLQEEPSLIPGWLQSMEITNEGMDDWQIETQRAVPDGFLDLVLFAPAKALVIIESKLGSTTDFPQLKKYIRYAKGVSVTGPRALVFMTQHIAPWPAGIEAEADDKDREKRVKLVLRRWQALGEFLRLSDRPLIQDFVGMLEQEGLVKPDALTMDDWTAWRTGNLVSRRLRTLLQEATPELQQVAPGFKKAYAVTLSNDGQIFRGFDFEGISLYVGFWPSQRLTRPHDQARITVYVLNKALPESERKAAGQAAVEASASPSVAMSGWGEQHVVRTTPAQEVLTATDFDSQRDQFASHVRATLDHFREIGYLLAHDSGGQATEPLPPAGGA